MTGTGTQADPYIVDTWADFVTAVGNSGAYVEIAQNTVWDMNDILPSGLTSAVVIKCGKIEGNFAEIRNLRVSASEIFRFSAPTDIYRLNILNITDAVYNKDRNWFYTVQSGTSGTACFNNCAITGLITSGYFAYAFSFLKIRFANDETNGCSINIRFGGDAALNNSYVSFRNSLLEFGGVSSGSSSYAFSTLENCFIRGECPWKTACIDSEAANVFDMKISNLTSQASSTKYKQNVVNTDKVTAQEAYTGYLTLVTENQLHDAEYLKSAGFPIL